MNIIKILETGGTGTVYLVKIHSKNYVLKVIPVRARNEIETRYQKFFRKANFPKIFTVRKDSDFIFLLEEYLPGTSLREIVLEANPDIESLESWIKTTASILIYLNRLGILHRDIKPRNFIIGEDNTLFLIDFGSSKFVDTIDLIDTEVIGTRNYTAPERYQRIPATVQSEIFAFGCLLFFMFTKEAPREYRGIRKYFIGWDLFKFKKKIPKKYYKIIRRCMHFNPKKRYRNFQEILNAIEEVSN